MNRPNSILSHISILLRHKIIIYAVIGGFGATLDLLLFYALLINFDPKYYVLYHVIGYAAGTIFSFFMNLRYNFRLKEVILIRFIRFFIAAFIGFSVSTVLIYFLVSGSYASEAVSKIIVLVIVFFIQYFINKTFSFSARIYK